jgi:hypothetical protein
MFWAADAFTECPLPSNVVYGSNRTPRPLPISGGDPATNGSESTGSLSLHPAHWGFQLLIASPVGAIASARPLTYAIQLVLAAQWDTTMGGVHRD